MKYLRLLFLFVLALIISCSDEDSYDEIEIPTGDTSLKGRKIIRTSGQFTFTQYASKLLVFTFYIEFRGEISPFIFKLSGKQQLSVKFKDSAAQRTVLPPNFGESKFIPSQVFYSPPSYLLRQDLFKFLRF